MSLNSYGHGFLGAISTGAGGGVPPASENISTQSCNFP